MIKQLSLRLRPEVAMQMGALRQYILKEEGLRAERLQALVIRKRSIDARQRQIFINLTLELYIDEPLQEEAPFLYPDVSASAHEAIVVGAGPAGLFAALRLIQLGVRPIVLERGKDVHTRRRDIAKISRLHTVDPESNYSFGEGGAGAFSDGKLYTRSKKRGDVERILRIFVQHGADANILIDAHPHIGTDRLPRIIETMREQIIRAGGEVHFQTRVDEILLRDGVAVGVRATHSLGEEETRDREFIGPVLLATGHSARDTYRHLCAAGVPLEAKGIAVGVRLEHPAELIDAIQYHARRGARPALLPTAEYSYSCQVEGRGVYSFCMCPGGFVVPAASGPEQVVVNGMSPSHRNGRWSNSGMVVEIRPDDLLRSDLSLGETEGPEVLRGLQFQEALEHMAWLQGGRKQTAPAQRMADFVNRRLGASLPESSYAPGLLASPLHFWLPAFVSQRLAEGFRTFGRRNHGFLTNEAIIIGVETRTSSPVRIVRDATSLASPAVRGLFPCGEGAGYAGGIVSAAIDGERCAEALAASFGA